MRSRMDPDLRGRCPRCFLRLEHCGCNAVVLVDTRTRLVVVRHAREAFKSTNSVRWAELALSNLEVHPYTGREGVDAGALDLAGAWLLFPGDEGATLPASPPERLVVLDGTWRQVRRMYRALPQLHRMPRLSLAGALVRGPRLRRYPGEARLSTLEALAFAIERLEGSEKAAPLFALHERMVQGTQAGRGRHRGPLKAPVP